MDDIIQGPLETLDLHLRNGHPLESEHKESQSTSRGEAGKEEREKRESWSGGCHAESELSPRVWGPQRTE